MQDILLDTKAFDIQLRDLNSNVEVYSAEWEQSETDPSLSYLNVFVPQKDVNKIDFSNGKREVHIQAKYFPSFTVFSVRLVVSDSSEKGYQLLSKIKAGIPEEFYAFSRLDYGSDLFQICASQLPYVNIDGRFSILLKLSSGVLANVAEIYSLAATDFAIGDSNDQEAKLLSICAPGKYYRYPSTGVDVTKYINSVVQHTELGENMSSQFERDSKFISDADFDSSDGSLDVLFMGEKEDPAGSLQSIDSLDTELLKKADDDFVRETLKEMSGTTPSSVFEIVDLDAVRFICKLDGEVTGTLLQGTVEYDRIFNSIGEKQEMAGYSITTANVSKGDVLIVNMQRSFPLPILFKIVNSGGDTLFMQATADNFIYFQTKVMLVVEDCIISYNRRYLDDVEHGIFKMTVTDDELKSLIAIASDRKTGAVSAILSGNTSIQGLRPIDHTGEIIGTI